MLNMETKTTKKTRQLIREKESKQKCFNNPKTNVLYELEEANKHPITEYKESTIDKDLLGAVEMGLLDETSARHYVLSTLGHKAIQYYKDKINKIHYQDTISFRAFITLFFSFCFALASLVSFSMYLKPLVRIRYLSAPKIFSLLLSTIILIISVIAIFWAIHVMNTTDDIESIRVNQLIPFFKHIHMNSKDIKNEIKIAEKYSLTNKSSLF